MEEAIERTENLLAQDFIDRDVGMRQLLANQLEIMSVMQALAHLDEECFEGECGEDGEEEWMDDETTTRN